MAVITQEMREAAKRAGACSVPRVGTKIASLDSRQLQWAETNLPEIARRVAAEMSKAVAEIRGVVPLSLWSGSGYGHGSGCGSGDGDGYGYGYGYGCGYGDGYGYGYGCGYDILLEGA